LKDYFAGLAGHPQVGFTFSVRIGQSSKPGGQFFLYDVI